MLSSLIDVMKMIYFRLIMNLLTWWCILLHRLHPYNRIFTHLVDPPGPDNTTSSTSSLSNPSQVYTHNGSPSQEEDHLSLKSTGLVVGTRDDSDVTCMFSNEQWSTSVRGEQCLMLGSCWLHQGGKRWLHVIASELDWKLKTILHRKKKKKQL